MRQMRHGQKTPQTPPTCYMAACHPLLLSRSVSLCLPYSQRTHPIPNQGCQSFVINHFRAALPQNDTRLDGQTDRRTYRLVGCPCPASSSCHLSSLSLSLSSPSLSHPPLCSASLVVCTFWGSQIVLLPRIQQIGKCSQVAAHVPQIPLILQPPPALPPLTGCPQTFNNKKLNKSFWRLFG